MANKKITELPAANLPIVAGVKFEAVQGGVNVQVDADDMPGSGGGGAVDSVNGATGVVVLDAGDIAFTPTGTISATDVQAAIAEVASEAGSSAWGSITGTLASQTDLDTALGLKADLASPTFTGTPSLPTGTTAITQTSTDSSTKLATTAFVQANLAAAKSMVVSVTDEVSNISTGTAKVSFRMPYAMTLTSVRASLNVAQASGSIFTVDINEAGTTILSTKLTIDNTATTSVGAATPAVISDASLADNAIITVDVDQIGNGSAIGLKITLIGT